MAQKKKNNKKYYDLDKNMNEGMSKSTIVLTIIGVVAFFACIYGLTVMLMNKGEKREPTPEASISYDKILAGSSLIQNPESYVVVFYDVEDNDEIFSAVVDYKSRGKGSIYYVDLKDGLNSYVISDKNVLDVKSASDLRVKNPTLIKVKKGKITDSKSGKKDILGYLA